MKNRFSQCFIATLILVFALPSANALLSLGGSPKIRANRVLLASKHNSPNSRNEIIHPLNTHSSSPQGTSDDCCDKCADDEACKIDKNGCECWKPASVASSTSENYSFLKFKAGVYAPNGVFNDIQVSTGTGSSLEQGESDCCDKCADDEACKVDKNGCECWKPASSLHTHTLIHALKIKGILFLSKMVENRNMIGCCVGTHTTERVTRECAAFAFEQCSNGLAQASGGETCYWDSSRICLPPQTETESVENGEGCCISTQASEHVRRECARFNHNECDNSQGSNGETCYWSAEATCPRESTDDTATNEDTNGCCVGTDPSERVARECGAFSFDECSNGVAQGSNGETCYWDSSRMCSSPTTEIDNTERGEGCCISTQSSYNVRLECTRFSQEDCDDSQGSNGETCYWSAEAVCPREEKDNYNDNDDMRQTSDERISANAVHSHVGYLLQMLSIILLLY